jgi:flagellar biosynthesis protein FlhB
MYRLQYSFLSFQQCAGVAKVYSFSRELTFGKKTVFIFLILLLAIIIGHPHYKPLIHLEEVTGDRIPQDIMWLIAVKSVKFLNIFKV